MATVPYFWHGFIHRVQHLCTFNIVAPPTLNHHILPYVWKVSYTISASIFVDPYWPPYSTNKFISCCTGPSHCFFHFGEEIVIAWTYIGWIRWMFQNLPFPAAQEVYGSSSGVTPCIVMKNVGVLYHQVSSFSPESVRLRSLRESCCWVLRHFLTC